MFTFEKSILYLVVYLTIFYNIERVDLGQINSIDISTVVYILVLIALMMILLLPKSTGINLYLMILLWIVFYIGIRLAFIHLYQRPLWGGVFTYLTITEVSMSSVAIILGYQVRRHLNDFRQSVEALTLSDINRGVQNQEKDYEDIQLEFLRSRRHQYNLSILVVQPDEASVKVELNRSVMEIQKEMMNRYAISKITSLARNLVRRTDKVIDPVENKNSFIIMLPETDTENAKILAQRFQSTVDKIMGIKINIGMAAFPDDGLTFEDLVDKAGEKIRDYKLGEGRILGELENSHENH